MRPDPGAAKRSNLLVANGSSPTWITNVPRSGSCACSDPRTTKDVTIIAIGVLIICSGKRGNEVPCERWRVWRRERGGGA
jgi:hypothetical protein